MAIQYEFEGFIRLKDSSKHHEIIKELNKVLEKYQKQGVLEASSITTYLSRDEMDRLDDFDRE